MSVFKPASIDLYAIKRLFVSMLVSGFRSAIGRAAAWFWKYIRKHLRCGVLYDASLLVEVHALHPDGQFVNGIDLPAADGRKIWSASDRAGRCLRAVIVQRGSPACGRTAAALGLRQRLDVDVIAVWRGDVYYPDPGKAHALLPNDRVVLNGSPAFVTICTRLFRSTPFSAPFDTEAT